MTHCQMTQGMAILNKMIMINFTMIATNIISKVICHPLILSLKTYLLKILRNKYQAIIYPTTATLFPIQAPLILLMLLKTIIPTLSWTSANKTCQINHHSQILMSMIAVALPMITSTIVNYNSSRSNIILDIYCKIDIENSHYIRSANTIINYSRIKG